MRIGRIACGLAAVALGLALVTVAEAGKFNKKINIGDQAAEWSGVIGTDDKLHALADFKDKKAVVIIFTCNHCPVAIANEDRMIQLQKDYADKGLQLVAINVNNVPEDVLDPMKARAKEKKFNFPYLYDSSQKTAKDYGATVTPHAYLLDAKGKVAYMGAIDNEPMNAADATEHYLRDAIDAVLAGKAPATTETRQQGCGIQYEK